MVKVICINSKTTLCTLNNWRVVFQINDIKQYLRWFEPETSPVDMHDMQKAENVFEDALFQLARAHIFTEK